MNIIEMTKQAGLKRHQEQAPGIDGVVGSWEALEELCKLVAAQEQKAWEHKFARLQNLMDIREIQPNKPCCLAARADERDRACAYMRQMHDAYSIASYPPRGTT